jgi:16S rRNA (cytosine967-C5)-methyltransferase
MAGGERVPPQAIAARALAAVLQDGRYLDAVLREQRAAAGALAPLVQEMAYGVARRYDSLAALATQLLREPLKARDQDLHALLLVGLYQLREMQTPEARAVNETVQAAVTFGKPWARALLNACLRRHQRERAALDAAIAGDEAARFDHPRWLLDALRAAWPGDWQAIVVANNRRPPLWLRVNTRRATRAALLSRGTEQGLAATSVAEPDSALLIEPPQPVEALPGFREGELSVQDAAAQFAAPLLDARPGERVLDACAAPGGKTAHLLERTPGLELLALDVAPERAARIRENLERLGLAATVRAADAARPADWWDGRAFDRVLLDVPCSASGVIRRHPDVKRRRRAADLPRLQATQRALLAALWPLLKPGGKLLYVTCSILPDENERQISHFLEHHPDAREWPIALPAGRARAHGWQLLPTDQLPDASAPLDGFFFAGLDKVA